MHSYLRCKYHPIAIFVCGLLAHGNNWSISRVYINEINNNLCYISKSYSVNFINHTDSTLQDVSLKLNQFYANELHLIKEGNAKLAASLYNSINPNIRVSISSKLFLCHTGFNLKQEDLPMFPCNASVCNSSCNLDEPIVKYACKSIFESRTSSVLPGKPVGYSNVRSSKIVSASSVRPSKTTNVSNVCFSKPITSSNACPSKPISGSYVRSVKLVSVSSLCPSKQTCGSNARPSKLFSSINVFASKSVYGNSVCSKKLLSVSDVCPSKTTSVSNVRSSNMLVLVTFVQVKLFVETIFAQVSLFAEIMFVKVNTLLLISFHVTLNSLVIYITLIHHR